MMREVSQIISDLENLHKAYEVTGNGGCSQDKLFLEAIEALKTLKPIDLVDCYECKFWDNESCFCALNQQMGCKTGERKDGGENGENK